MASSCTAALQEPDSKVVPKSYKSDIMNGFEGEKPLQNSVGKNYSISSSLVNFNDPIQIHLLVETALSDSKGFEILSQEEVDDLKKQCHAITSRIEQSRQNLAVQSKYRDATLSLSKLYPSSSPDDKVQQPLLANSQDYNVQDQDQDLEKERMLIEKKYETLTAELSRLEKQLISCQERFLKHTAGILQLTYQGAHQSIGELGNSEQLYTYSNTNESCELLNHDFIFDEKSFYKELEGFSDLWNNFNPLQTPPSTVIKKTETKLEQLSKNLRQIIVKFNPDRETSYRNPPNGSSATGVDTQILDSYLEYLDQSIITIDLDQKYSKEQQIKMSAQHEALMEQKDILQRQIAQQREQNNKSDAERDSEMDKSIEKLAQITSLQASTEDQLILVREQLKSTLDKLEDANQREIIRSQSSKSEDIANNLEVREKIREAEERARKAENQAQQVEDSSRATLAELEARRKDVAVLEEQLRVMKDNLAVSQAELQVKVSDSEALISSLKQELSTATSTKATSDIIMERKIMQLADSERELNSIIRKKDMILSDKEEELDAVKTEKDRLLAEKERQLTALMREKDMILADRAIEIDQEIREKDRLLAEKEEELDAAKKEKERLLAEKEGGLNDIIRGKDMILANKEEELDSVKKEKDRLLAEKERQLTAVMREKDMILADRDIKIDQAIREKDRLLAEKERELTAVMREKDMILADKGFKVESVIKEKDLLLAAKEKEIDEAQMDIARLQTEVTIAKAELDSAYGSRSQRAARVAPSPAVQKEIDDLTQINNSLMAEIAALTAQKTAPKTGIEDELKKLRSELAETIGDYELMTKASIQWEKEREQLEETIDMLRDAKEDIETQLSDEKVRWLGMRSPGGEGLSPASTSTTILKNEFKKMMRDTRAESARALRAEQTERRRLEDEMRALKRAQGVGKSRLS